MVARRHRLVGVGSQDALYLHDRQDYLIGVICDGCGSSRYSQVGALLGARLISERLARHLADVGPSVEQLDRALERTRQDLLAYMRVLALALGGEDQSLREVVDDYLLFTTVGLVLTPILAAVFALGDGLYALDGEMTTIAPANPNAPAYLGYALLDGLDPAYSPEQLRFQVLVTRPTPMVQSLLIASDGAGEFSSIADCRRTNLIQPVGPLSQFWTDDRYFCNPDALRRKLAMLNCPLSQMDHATNRLITEPGLLADDTTILIVRRRPDSPQLPDEEG